MFQDEAYTIRDGELKVEVETGRKLYLYVLPLTGENSHFSSDVKYSKGNKACFTLITDSNYNLISNSINYAIRMNEGVIRKWHGSLNSREWK